MVVFHQLLVIGCKSEEIHQKIVGGIESERRFIGALINKTRSRSKEIGFFAGPVVIVNDYLALTAAHTVHMMEVRFSNHPTPLTYIILCFRKNRTEKAVPTLEQAATN